MDPVDSWTGRLACALQEALRLTKEDFSARTGIGLRTIADWHQRPDITPKTSTQQILDTLLEQASDTDRRRFAQLAGLADSRGGDNEEAERRLSEDPHIGTALEWLDTHAEWTPGTSRRKVAARLATLDLRDLQDRGNRRGQVNQRQLADALNAYYGAQAGYDTYRATCDGHSIHTSILTRSEWLDMDCELAPETDRLTLANIPTDRAHAGVDDLAAGHAVNRLAEALTAGIRIIDAPLYRLLTTDVQRGLVGGSVGLTTFAHYALTMDLLEGELVDALSIGYATSPGALPLRDRHLPDAASVVDVGKRLCAGGALALCAIARPATPYRPADYLLLIQERSGRVLNAARRLAVTPKGFHQPMTDYRQDARITSTLLREMEEELFGRDEVDNTVDDPRSADPMHPSRLSRPMRWLTRRPDRLKIEFTGFGLNLVSGNYECACLIVIDDETFWEKFGGHIEANWETGSLRRYSSQDRGLIVDLIGDPAWSNEGLFALLQGLRQLARRPSERVNLPVIDWSLA